MKNAHRRATGVSEDMLENVAAALEACVDRGLCLRANGGVRSGDVAECAGISRHHATKSLKLLCEQGRADRVRGLSEHGPVPSYLPAGGERDG
jgi:hypothetical protein